jgi:hypothetical protein
LLWIVFEFFEVGMKISSLRVANQTGLCKKLFDAEALFLLSAYTDEKEEGDNDGGFLNHEASR